MLMREAARENERMAGGANANDDRLATLAGVASQLVASNKSSAGADASASLAPEILVVPTSQTPGDRSSGADVSANVTLETSRPRSLPTGTGLGVR